MVVKITTTKAPKTRPVVKSTQDPAATIKASATTVSVTYLVVSTTLDLGACDSAREHTDTNLQTLADHTKVPMMFNMAAGASTVDCKGSVFYAKLAFKAVASPAAKEKALKAFTKDTPYLLQLQTGGADVPVKGAVVSALMLVEKQTTTAVTQANGDGGDTSDSTAVIVGVVVAAVILLCVGVAAFLLYKRNSDEAVRSSLRHHSRSRGNNNRAGRGVATGRVVTNTQHVALCDV